MNLDDICPPGEMRVLDRRDGHDRILGLEFAQHATKHWGNSVDGVEPLYRLAAHIQAVSFAVTCENCAEGPRECWTSESGAYVCGVCLSEGAQP